MQRLLQTFDLPLERLDVLPVAPDAPLISLAAGAHVPAHQVDLLHRIVVRNL